MKVCPNCGKEFPNENTAFCDACGCAMNVAGTIPPPVAPPAIPQGFPMSNLGNAVVPQIYELELKEKKKIKRKYNTFAVIISIVFFLAGTVILFGAMRMAGIQSVAGNSIMEASYQGMGTAYKGLAIAVYGFGAVLTLAVHWMGTLKADYIKK